MGEDEIHDTKFPYSWFEFVDDYTKNYAVLKFASRNLLDSAAGGTFMEISLGEVHTIEEINVLSGRNYLLARVLLLILMVCLCLL